MDHEAIAKLLRSAPSDPLTLDPRDPSKDELRRERHEINGKKVAVTYTTITDSGYRFEGDPLTDEEAFQLIRRIRLWPIVATQ